MSHLGTAVLVTDDPLCDPMGEFHVEDDEPTKPMPVGSLIQRVAAASRITPVAPPVEPVAPQGAVRRVVGAAGGSATARCDSGDAATGGLCQRTASAG